MLHLKFLQANGRSHKKETITFRDKLADRRIAASTAIAEANCAQQLNISFYGYEKIFSQFSVYQDRTGGMFTTFALYLLNWRPLDVHTAAWVKVPTAWMVLAALVSTVSALEEPSNSTALIGADCVIPAAFRVTAAVWLVTGPETFSAGALPTVRSP